jgi:hypothetical protein
MDIFYAVTTITLGNVKKTPFWQTPWLHGMKPNYIAPLIFVALKRKNWKVSQVLCEDAWVTKIVLDISFTMEHFTQFVDL